MNDNKKERWKKILEEEQKKTESREETISEPATRTGMVVNNPKVNIRTQPSKDSKVIMVVDRGTKFEIVEEVPGYFKIVLDNYPGRIGYIHCDYFVELQR